jgi:branched-subunit amino acid ABC-type transport system permease component
MHIVNLSHGELYMLGAYLTWLFTSVVQNFWISIVLASIVTGLVGVLLLTLPLKKMLGAGPLRWALLTLGFGYVLRELAQHVFGTDFKIVDLPLSGAVPHFGGAYRLAVTMCGIGIIALLTAFLSSTRYGLFIRAVASNREAAAVVGISVIPVYAVVCGISAVLAGAAGGFMLPVTSAYPTMGLEVLVVAVVVVVVGGMGNVKGTLIASIVAGEMQSLLTFFMTPGHANLMTLMALLMIIVARKTGARS